MVHFLSWFFLLVVIVHLRKSTVKANLTECPLYLHHFIFPQVSAVVHHGGCGTTAAGLLAGKPSIICSFFGDQPFWAQHVERLGVGPSPIPQGKFSVERLCHAIDQVMNDTAMQQKVAELGHQLREENGTENAVAFINDWMSKR